MDLEKFTPTISIERLKSFAVIKTICTEEYLIKWYELNIKLSQAFYPILSIFEVTLRNSIDTMLRTVFSSNWLEEELKQQNLLFDYDYTRLQEAYKKLSQRYGENNVTRGKIISELTLGFWVSLCSKKYNPKIWTKKGAFRGVFVNYPAGKREQIHKISQKLTRIKNFRNRIFHYEPIVNKDNEYDIYENILDILAYLPNDGSQILQNTDNFLPVAKMVIKALEEEVKMLKNIQNNYNKKP